MAGAHLGAAALVALLDIDLTAKVLLWLGLSASLVHSAGTHALRRLPAAIHALTAESDGSWTFALQAGTTTSGCEMRSRFVHPWLVLLTFAPPGKRRARAVCIAGDALDPEVFRQLRVRLLLQSAAA